VILTTAAAPPACALTPKRAQSNEVKTTLGSANPFDNDTSTKGFLRTSENYLIFKPVFGHKRDTCNSFQGEIEVKKFSKMIINPH